MTESSGALITSTGVENHMRNKMDTTPTLLSPKRARLGKFQCCVVIRVHRPNVSPCCCNGCCCKTSSRRCFALLIVSTEEAPGNCGGQLPQTIPLLELGFVLRAACDDPFLVTMCV